MHVDIQSYIKSYSFEYMIVDIHILMLIGPIYVVIIKKKVTIGIVTMNVRFSCDVQNSENKFKK